MAAADGKLLYRNFIESSSTLVVQINQATKPVYEDRSAHSASEISIWLGGKNLSQIKLGF
ncbi:hypothetical protein AV944_06810 [Sphingomonas sp. LK11]|nr:hypothetical protein AV944_06810 [Sphingomonas sp. LK11]